MATDVSFAYCCANSDDILDTYFKLGPWLKHTLNDASGPDAGDWLLMKIALLSGLYLDLIGPIELSLGESSTDYSYQLANERSFSSYVPQICVSPVAFI
jgi:hypothetical protein